MASHFAPNHYCAQLTYQQPSSTSGSLRRLLLLLCLWLENRLQSGSIEEICQFCFFLANGALRRFQKLHLHALLVEAMAAAELQVIVALFDEPFADVA